MEILRSWSSASLLTLLPSLQVMKHGRFWCLQSMNSATSTPTDLLKVANNISPITGERRTSSQAHCQCTSCVLRFQCRRQQAGPRPNTTGNNCIPPNNTPHEAVHGINSISSDSQLHNSSDYSDILPHQLRVLAMLTVPRVCAYKPNVGGAWRGLQYHGQTSRSSSVRLSTWKTRPDRLVTTDLYGSPGYATACEVGRSDMARPLRKDDMAFIQGQYMAFGYTYTRIYATTRHIRR